MKRTTPRTESASGIEPPHAARATQVLAVLEGVELGRQLPHLLRRAHFEAEAGFAPVFGETVTSRQLALLVAVAQAPGASQSDLARRIALDANTCSDLISRLCTRRLLRRERSPDDARAYRIHLTRAGERVLNEAVPQAGRYARNVASRLTAAQQRELVDLLRQMLGMDG